MKLKKFFRMVLPVVLMLTVSFMFAGAVVPDSGASAADAPAKSTITVTGTSTVYAEPDMATITLGVETRNAIAATAQSENSTKMQAVINSLVSAGIARKDIATSGYNIYTDYTYGPDGRSTPNGYIVNNSVTVTVRDIKKVGAVIDASGKSGANSMGGISFGISNYDKFYNDALKLAVGQAKSKGDVIAAAVGTVIGKPSSISESSGYYYPMAGSKSLADSAGGATPIEAGQISVSANVTVTYEY